MKEIQAQDKTIREVLDKVKYVELFMYEEYVDHLLVVTVYPK